MSSKLKISLTHDQVEDYFEHFVGDRVSGIFAAAAKLYGENIKSFCGITEKTEHQLDNFGPGSAWLFESEFELSIRFCSETSGYMVVIHDTTHNGPNIRVGSLD